MKGVYAALDYVYAIGGTDTGRYVYGDNVALASISSSTASASSSFAGFLASYVNDGDKRQLPGHYWNDNTAGAYPDTIQVDFLAAHYIGKVVVHTLRDDQATNHLEASDTDTISLYGLTNFTVDTWNGAAWVTQATITGNTLVKRTVTFAPVSTTKVRLSITGTNDGYSRVIELECYAVVGIIGTVYVANAPIVSEPTDTPASTAFYDCIIDVPRYSRQIDQQTLGGRIKTTRSGDLVIDNGDGRLGFLLDLIIDGQEVRFFLGDPIWPLSQWRQIFVATMDRAEITKRGEITIRLRDSGLLLDKYIVGSPIGGTGPNADKPAPIALGYIASAEAILEDLATLQYRFCEAPYWYAPNAVAVDAQGILDVTDNGASLIGRTVSGISGVITFTAGTDYIDVGVFGFIDDDTVSFYSTGSLPTTNPQIEASVYTLHQYWVVSSDGISKFKIALTRGGAPIDITAGAFTGTMTVQQWGFYNNHDGSLLLSHSPAGVISAEIFNAPFGPGNIGGSTAAGLYYWLARIVGGLSSAQYAGAHVSYVSMFGPDPLGLDSKVQLYVAERTNLLDILDKTAFSANSFYGAQRDGKFVFGRIQPHLLTFQSPVTSFGEGDVILDDARVSRLEPKFKALAINANYNHPPLSVIAAGVPVDEAAQLRLNSLTYELRKGFTGNELTTDYATTPWQFSVSMTDSGTLDTLLQGRDRIDADNWMIFYRDKFLPHVEILTFTAPFGGGIGTKLAYELELADLVNVYLPYSIGDSTTNIWQVLGIDLSITKQTVGLTLIRRRASSVTEVSGIGGGGGGGGDYVDVGYWDAGYDAGA